MLLLRFVLLALPLAEEKPLPVPNIPSGAETRESEARVLGGRAGKLEVLFDAIWEGNIGEDDGEVDTMDSFASGPFQDEGGEVGLEWGGEVGLERGGEVGLEEGRVALFSQELTVETAEGTLPAETAGIGLGEGLLDEENKGLASGSYAASTNTPGSADFFKKDLSSLDEDTCSVDGPTETSATGDNSSGNDSCTRTTDAIFSSDSCGVVVGSSITTTGAGEEVDSVGTGEDVLASSSGFDSVLTIVGGAASDSGMLWSDTKGLGEGGGAAVAMWRESSKTMIGVVPSTGT